MLAKLPFPKCRATRLTWDDNATVLFQFIILLITNFLVSTYPIHVSVVVFGMVSMVTSYAKKSCSCSNLTTYMATT